MTPEHQRLEEARRRTAHWKRWGPYLSERRLFLRDAKGVIMFRDDPQTPGNIQVPRAATPRARRRGAPWALILAGGDGTRLRALTREIAGDDLQSA